MKLLQSIATRTTTQTTLICQAHGGVLKHLFLPLAVCAAAVVSANASSVIDSFDDVKGATDGITLPTLNNTGIGGVGFTSKYEQTGSSVVVLRTNDLTVSLANYVSGQAAGTQNWSVAATTASSGTARRTQTRSTPTMSGTIWFSFLASLLTPNGDAALVFNGGYNSGGSGSPASANSTPGMRVGLGSNSRDSFRGALGVGPATAGSTSLEITNIVKGVNGDVTAAGFVPTNGTPVLILGRIDYDPVYGYPRVSIWYNPDVPDADSLPAPTLSFSDPYGTNVPYFVTRIGYQVVRSPSPPTQNEAIDNVKVSDEPNGFEIVYKNAALPIPMVSVTATVPQGSEEGPTNLVFSVTTDRAVVSDLVIPYTVSGLATNGYVPFSFPPDYTNADYTDANFDPNTQTSSVTISAGHSNATVTLYVIDDSLPEANESVILTLQAQPDVYLLGAGSATGSILDNNDAHTSVQYMFERTGLPEIWDTNLTAQTATVAAGFNFTSTSYLNTGFGPLDYPSPSSCFSAPGNVTPDNQADALAQGSYASFQIAPVPGRIMTLTNFQFMALYGNYQYQVPGATGAVVFVRSSLDNFASDLGNFVLLPAESLLPNPGWYTNNIPLDSSFANLSGQVEFRLYFFDDSSVSQVAVRVDNLFIGATTAPAPPAVQQVFVTGTVTNAAQPATSGLFTVTRVGDLTDPLTVYYAMTGTASNGTDYAYLSGVTNFAAGASIVQIPLAVIDNGVPYVPLKTAVLTLLPNPNYGVVSPASTTVSIADNDVYGALAVYQFNENNNTALSLAAVAAGTVPTALTNQLVALNATAGAGLGSFGAGGNAGNSHGYGTAEFVSSPSEVFVRASILTNDEADAVLADQYFSFKLQPYPGYALNPSRFTAWARFDASSASTANWVLRSSVDGFAADLGNWTVTGSGTTVSYQLLTTSLADPAFQHLAGAVEFRLYFYTTDTNGASHYLRMDDVYFQGSVNTLLTTQPMITSIAATSGSPVVIHFTGGTSDSAGVFHLQSSATATGSFTDDNLAAVTGSGGAFQATTAANGDARFYRIRR